MSNIENLTISDVCDFIGGSQPPKTFFSETLKEGYIRFVQTRDFKTNNFITYIPKHLTTKFFGKEEIMIGRYGPPIFQIFRGMEGAYNVALLKAKPKKNILNDYLYYFLLQKSIFEYVDKLSARTGGQTGVDLVSLYKYPINLPNISVQQAVSKVLSDLDAKIEINNRINSELEAMAKMLYDYWFVQFDFPYVTSSGVEKPYKSSGGKMVWNEELNREIPEGWEVKFLTKEMDLQYGFPFSTSLFNDSNEGVPVIRIRDILNCSISNYSTEKVDEKYKLLKGDIIVGMDGNFHINYWNKEHCYLNQRSLRIRSNENSISEMQARFSIEPYIKAREKNVSRTTVAHLSAKDVNDLKILKATPVIQLQANKFFKSILNKIISNSVENQELASLRDWLLPMLMNGQVRVGDVEEVYEDASEILAMVAEPVSDMTTNGKKQSKVVSIKPTNVEIYKRSLLAAEIVWQLKDTNTLGHLKLQKMLYLCQEIGNMKLPMNFLKQAMGPYDNRLARSLDKQFVIKKWFEYQKEAPLKYKPLENCGGHREDFKKYFEEEVEQVNYLLNKFKRFTSNQIEAVATLYACWKEALENQNLITDSLLISKFYQWSKEKEKFREDNLVKALDWMRRNRVEPY